MPTHVMVTKDTKLTSSFRKLILVFRGYRTSGVRRSILISRHLQTGVNQGQLRPVGNCWRRDVVRCFSALISPTTDNAHLQPRISFLHRQRPSPYDCDNKRRLRSRYFVASRLARWPRCKKKQVPASFVGDESIVGVAWLPCAPVAVRPVVRKWQATACRPATKFTAGRREGPQT
jgi:hypothetical protein